MPHVSGDMHHKRRAKSCPNGHPYATQTVRWRDVRRFNKTTQAPKTYRIRECRRCLNVHKKFQQRRRWARLRTRREAGTP